MEALIQLLHGVRPLSSGLETHLRGKIKHYKFKKGEVIVKAGEVASLILYLEKGLIRSYSFHDGEKASNYFMREGDIIISVISFFMQVPATDTIEALEDCYCWGITYDELENSYEDYMEFNIHGRKICINYYVKSELRWQSQHRKDSNEIYAWLMETDPELIRRVKNTHIASYLNVSRSGYYNIKKAYARQKRSAGPKKV